MVYLDNAATTRPSKAAMEALHKCAMDCYGNSASIHSFGIDAEKLIENSKKVILKRLKLNGELVFTSGATESNNMAIMSVVSNNRGGGKRIVTTTLEHPSISELLKRLEKNGFEIVRVAPCKFYEDAIAAEVNQDTILVCVSAVAGETGLILDTPRVTRVSRRNNPEVVVLVDAVQAFCKMDVGGDLVSISAHKIHGFKGIGALYSNRSVPLKPLLYGGGQENGLRSGTQPVELISAFETAVASFQNEISHVTRLHDSLVDQLEDIKGVVINSYDNSPFICNLSVPGIKGETLVHSLASMGVIVSTGTACSKGKKSGVLKSFGYTDSIADSSIRVSFSPNSTFQDVNDFVNVLKVNMKRLGK